MSNNKAVAEVTTASAATTAPTIAAELTVPRGAKREVLFCSPVFRELWPVSDMNMVTKAPALAAAAIAGDNGCCSKDDRVQKVTFDAQRKGRHHPKGFPRSPPPQY